MKIKLKSAFIAQIAMLFVALSLTCCSSNKTAATDEGIQFPKIFGGSEVPDEILNAPRVVETPPPRDLSEVPWPRLGDVPSKPTDFSPQPVIDQAIAEMQYERSRALGSQSSPTATKNYPLLPPQLPQR
ncbi:MAG: hypothetical protein WAO98_01490 [Alphaproteobacteria bacterium]